MEQISGVAGGMPYLALPRGCAPRAPLVVAWHLHDRPRSETAMSAPLAAHRQALPVGDGPLGLWPSVGAGRAGGARRDGPAAAAVALVSPAIKLAGVVAANERRFGVSYRWTAQSCAAAESWRNAAHLTSPSPRTTVN
jgi:hypothetical protein